MLLMAEQLGQHVTDVDLHWRRTHLAQHGDQRAA
jgi:hypothetical protein